MDKKKLPVKDLSICQFCNGSRRAVVDYMTEHGHSQYETDCVCVVENNIGEVCVTVDHSISKFIPSPVMIGRYFDVPRV